MTATYCFWLHPPTPSGRQIEIWNRSLQLYSSNEDSNQAECMGGDEGAKWCIVALIFPSSSIYHISLNNTFPFWGHRWFAQPFKTGGHRGGSVWVGSSASDRCQESKEKDSTKWVTASYRSSEFFMLLFYTFHFSFAIFPATLVALAHVQLGRCENGVVLFTIWRNSGSTNIFSQLLPLRSSCPRLARLG